MALRELRADGVRWVVWDVTPGLASAHTGQSVRPHLSGGWLVAQGHGEKRRIIPVPAGWEIWTDEHLLEAIRDAPVVPAGR